MLSVATKQILSYVKNVVYLSNEQLIMVHVIK